MSDEEIPITDAISEETKQKWEERVENIDEEKWIPLK